MEIKEMLKRASCIALSGLLVLSGQSLATETREATIAKIEQVNVGTILADKKLGYNIAFDPREYDIVSMNAPQGTNASWALVVAKLLEEMTNVEFSAKYIDYATASNSTTATNKLGYNRSLGEGGNIQLALGFLTSGRSSLDSNSNIGGTAKEYNPQDTTTTSAKAFAWDGKLNKVSPSTLNTVTKTGRLESYIKFPSIYKMTFDATYYTEDTMEQMTEASDRMQELSDKGQTGSAEFKRLQALVNALQELKEERSTTFAFSDPIIYDDGDNEQIMDQDSSMASYTAGDIEENRQAIKDHIIQYGAVAAQIYINDDYVKDHFIYMKKWGVTDVCCWCCQWYHWHGLYFEPYTDSEELRYYCKEGGLTPNQNVLIVGWDDEKVMPGAPDKGAYLVMDPEGIQFKYPNGNWNTFWGYPGNDKCLKYGSCEHIEVEVKTNTTEVRCYGNASANEYETVDTNFYWVSYYDYYIESNVYGITSFASEAPQKTYQHDNLGISSAIQPEMQNTYVYGANVFVRDTDVAERLDSISIASMDKLKYEVYVNPKNSNRDSDSFIKVAETEELNAGYNTIYFDEDIMLTGEEFVVAVKYISTDSTRTAKIGVQSPKKRIYLTEGEGESAITTETTQPVQYWQYANLSESTKEISFIGNTLDDLTDLYEDDMIVCIKAYTTEDPTYNVPVESVEIQKKSDLGVYENIENNNVTVLKGDQIDLALKINPDDAVYNKVNWKSSDEKIATIDDKGMVSTIGAGKVTITGWVDDEQSISATCTIDVRVPIESFVLNKNEVTILAGETNVLAGIFGPEDVTTTQIAWATSNKNVVKITDDGLLIGLNKGTAIITATVKDENGMHTATCKVKVPEKLVVDVLEVSLNKKTLTLQKGTRETLEATVIPTDATNTAVVWSSSNKNVAIVNANGRVTALSPGKCIITVTTVNGGETDTCVLTVTDKQAVATTGITLNQSSLKLEKDAMVQLTATVKPDNADDKTVQWSSSDLNIAKVSTSGLVTARTYGTATITAKTADGKHSAECVVTIEKPAVKVTGVTLEPSAINLEKDATYQLIAGVQPASADNGKVTWKTSNANIVKVDENGNITAVGYGDATITVTTDDGGYSKTCIVTVPKVVNVTGIELSKTSITLKKGRTSAIEVKVLPEDATNAETTYEISDESIISFEGDGIKGLKAGTATITFTTTEGEHKATCTVNVEELEETDIDVSSEDFTITDDNKIPDVPPETTVEDLKNEIKTEEGTEIVVKDKDGNVLEDTDIVGTGSSIEISKEIETTPEGETEPEKSTVTETFEIIVSGDVNGDGWLSATDVSIISQAILGETTLDDTYIEAGDLNGDGKITITDLTILMQQVSSEEEEDNNNEENN